MDCMFTSALRTYRGVAHIPEGFTERQSIKTNALYGQNKTSTKSQKDCTIKLYLSSGEIF